jgi:signal transduction histidine kinase
VKEQYLPKINSITEVLNVDSLQVRLDPTNPTGYLKQLLTLENSWSNSNNENSGSKLSTIYGLSDDKYKKKYRPIFDYWEGKSLVKQQRFDDAYKKFLIAKKGFETRKDTIGQIRVYCNLADLSMHPTVNIKIRNTKNGAAYAAQAVALAERYGDSYFLLLSLQYLSMAEHYGGDNPDVLKKILDRELDIIKENKITGRMKYATLNSHAGYYYSIGNPNKALEIFENNLINFRLHFSKKNYLAILTNISVVSQDLGHYEKARKYLAELRQLSNSKQYNIYKRNAYNEYSRLNSNLGNYKLAYQYLDSSTFVNEFTYELENVKKINKFEKAFENEELKLENKLTQRRINFITLALAVVSLLVIILIVLAFILHKERVASQKLADEIGNLAQVRDYFIKVVAHDIRSPMAAMGGLYRLLSNRLREKQYDEIEEISVFLEESAVSTKKLVDNLFYWGISQQEEMPFNPTKVSLSTVIGEVTTIYKPIIQAKEIELCIECSPSEIIYADLDGIKLILRNLIDNSLKHLPNEGGKLSILVANTDQRKVRIIIEDNGIGIDANKLTYINEVFESSNAVKTHEVKLGMGILLISKFVNRNLGEINAEQSPTAGLRFVLTFPKTEV